MITVRAVSVAIVAVAVLAATWAPLRADDDTADAARGASAVVARALTGGDASALRPVLPRRGKVLLRLSRLGPEEGYFSAAQVETLFADFLAAGRVESFELGRVEPDGEGVALAHATAAIVDREGRRGRVELHLAFEPEDARWVLRELRESP